MANKVDKFSRVDPYQARLAARAIPQAFVLSETKEGEAFWRRIMRRLEQIAKSHSGGTVDGG